MNLNYYDFVNFFGEFDASNIYIKNSLPFLHELNYVIKRYFLRFLALRTQWRLLFTLRLKLWLFLTPINFLTVLFDLLFLTFLVSAFRKLIYDCSGLQVSLTITYLLLGGFLYHYETIIAWEINATKIFLNESI